MFVIKTNTSLSIEDVTKSFEAKCSASGFALLHSYNYHEILKEKGFPIDREVFIYEICQAKVASMMLTEHPEFSPFMPCRISIYEDGDEVAIVAQDMVPLFEILEEDSILKEEAAKLFQILKDLMNALTKK